MVPFLFIDMTAIMLELTVGMSNEISMNVSQCVTQSKVSQKLIAYFYLNSLGPTGKRVNECWGFYPMSAAWTSSRQDYRMK